MYVFYTYDPTEDRPKFRVFNVKVESYYDAKMQAIDHVEKMVAQGCPRKLAAWELESTARGMTSSFTDTEARMREIALVHDIAPWCGMLDLSLVGKLKANAVRLPFEAHMPPYRKATPTVCMAAIRALCCDGAHDPQRKFEGQS